MVAGRDISQKNVREGFGEVVLGGTGLCLCDRIESPIDGRKKMSSSVAGIG